MWGQVKRCAREEVQTCERGGKRKHMKKRERLVKLKASGKVWKEEATGE